MPLSIIIPVYNAAPFLKRCIESILNQDYTDFELLIVDDGSTDGSAQICDEIAKTDVRLTVLHQDNSGVNTARLNGVKMAKGNYVMFVDADDMLPDHAITLLMKETTGGYDIIRGAHKNIDISGKLVDKENYEIKNSILNSGEEFAIALHKGVIAPYLWGGIYRREALECSFFQKVIDYNLTIGEDCVINMFVSQMIHKVRIIPQTVYLYYINTSSVMHTKVMGREYAHRIDECISDYVEASNDEVKRLFILNQVRGAISRDFQFEIPFSIQDYRFVRRYINDAKNREHLYSSFPKKFTLFLRWLPLYFLYSRLYAYFKWVKGGRNMRQVI